MSDSYITLFTSVARNLKIGRVSGDAFRLWVQGLCYVQDAKTDGFIHDDIFPALGLPVPKREWAAELEAKVLWHRVEHGWDIHDYLKCNDSKEKREQKQAEATRRKREHDARQRGLKVIDVTPAQRRLPEAPARVDPATETRVEGEAAPTQVEAKLPASPPLVPPARDWPTKRGGPPLITSPLAYENLKASLGYLGARFRVPKTFHQELVGRYGGDEGTAEAALAVWYRGLEDAMGPDESIPDIYKFINGHFAVLVQARMAPVPVPRKKDDQRQSATDPAWRKQFDEATARKAQDK